MSDLEDWAWCPRRTPRPAVFRRRRATACLSIRWSATSNREKATSGRCAVATHEQQDDPEALLGSVSSHVVEPHEPGECRDCAEGATCNPAADRIPAAVRESRAGDPRDQRSRSTEPDSAYGTGAHCRSELQKAANFINDNYVGNDLMEIRARLISDLDKTRDSMNQAMHDIISVAQSAMEGCRRRRRANSFWPVRPT